MNDKGQLIANLRQVFNRLDDLLSGMREEQVTAPMVPSAWSIKDEIAHLWAWQQRSVARIQAALHNTEPQYPGLPESLNQDPDADVDPINAWIYETNKDKPWSSVYADWRAQFLHLLELAEQVPEKDLLEPNRYGTWMDGYALSDTLEGTYEHHDEHLDQLLAWLDQHGNMKSA